MSFICHIHNYTEYNQQWNVFSAFNPSKCTHTWSSGSRHCGARGAVRGSVPCSRVSPQSWTLPARAGIRIHNLGLPRVSSPTLYPLGHDCPNEILGQIYTSRSHLLRKLKNVNLSIKFASRIVMQANQWRAYLYVHFDTSGCMRKYF